jgi:hypothetical protein
VDDTAEAVHAPVVALNDAGAGWVAWAQYNASRNQLWVAAYQTRDIRPPTLDVEFPQNEMHLTEPSVRVEGSVYDATRVTVNGVEAEIGFDERFSLLIPLASGLNEVRVTASDDSGNEDSYIAAVYFDDPAVALQAQLDAANASLAKALLDVANATAQVGALTTQLADANAAVAEAQANVTAAQQAIDALEASGSATQDDLDAAQAALAAAEANVATLTTAQASLSSQLSTATANAAAALAAANSAQANATAAQTAAAGQTAAVSDAKASAGSAYTIGMLGLVLIGIALGAVGMMRKPKAMESAHQNPMYHDDGKTGDNPLHEKKE